jgi:hypothetical protein
LFAHIFIPQNGHGPSSKKRQNDQGIRFDPRPLANPLRLVEIFFGIVAVEAIACGCVVVGSAGGGLAEAIGPCGVTFPNGDAHALVSILTRLLGDPAEVDALRRPARQHLAQFTKRHVASRYLEALAAVS